jgi:hypothetical protein
MVSDAVTPPSPAYLDIVGSDEKFPVRRIYCTGKNDLAHVREMEQDERDPPVIFMKPADALVRNGGENPYPVFTNNFHYECELVVAMKSGGYNISEADAASHIFGYAVGLDMTRRDHQAAVMEKGMPWEITKAFDHSAPVGPVTPVSQTGIMTSLPGSPAPSPPGSPRPAVRSWIAPSAARSVPHSRASSWVWPAGQRRPSPARSRCRRISADGLNTSGQPAPGPA